MSILRPVAAEAAGTLNLCAGQKAGTEAIIHEIGRAHV